MSYNVFEEAYLVSVFKYGWSFYDFKPINFFLEMQLQTTAYPKEHDFVLSTLKSMALVLAKNNQFAEAMPIFRKILQQQEERFGRDSEHYIEIMGMIGCILAKDMEFEESAGCLKVVVEWQTKNLTTENPKTKMTMRTLEMVEDVTKGKISIWV